MTRDEIAEIRARADAATMGPWVGSNQYGLLFVLSQHNEILLYAKAAFENIKFCAAARTDVPSLCDALTAALDAKDALLEALEALIVDTGTLELGGYDVEAAIANAQYAINKARKTP